MCKKEEKNKLENILCLETKKIIYNDNVCILSRIYILKLIKIVNYMFCYVLYKFINNRKTDIHHNNIIYIIYTLYIIHIYIIYITDTFYIYSTLCLLGRLQSCVHASTVTLRHGTTGCSSPGIDILSEKRQSCTSHACTYVCETQERATHTHNIHFEPEKQHL